ncbi:FecR domain-containing protein [Echinicola marina]|uniref:FecR family protein n=1 Tax=Echinicola marina TaxID=2859768 RepID=UPI001CF65FCB|nr:FecR family protein [Echinicola marina]UCS92101.1 FecR domain-containing protein [Echinicola marina]
MNKDNLYHFYAKLIHKELAEELSAKEKTALDKWLLEDPEHKIFYDKLVSDGFIDGELRKLERIDTDKSFQQLQSRISYRKQVPVIHHLWFKRMASVAAVLALFISAWITFQSIQKSVFNGSNKDKAVITDVSPGEDKAILVLPNGEEIALEDLEEGNDRKIAGMQVSKRKDFVAISLAAAPQFVPEKISKIIVPIGGKYSVELQDGTKVWLNSASSLSFPSAFEKDKREVSLDGEAYFEVAHNPRSPFTVDANGTKVKVLGTHFNIKAYKNEVATKTTLLEGKVEVAHNGQKKMLVPGDQVISGQQLLVSQVSTKEVIAWKEGYFLFQSTRLDEILRQLERWYNIKVDAKGSIPMRHFNAAIDMDTPLSKVIEVLELSGGIDFEFKNGILYVTEKD